MKQLINKIISITIAFNLIFQQSLIAASIEIDKNANKKYQASLEMAHNNKVPVLNIVKPDNHGLSHNKFTNYNVNKEGLILNNSNKNHVKTQLAGYIFGNKNFTGKTAKTILNEVTSKNKTRLRGYTELAGDKARVIIANPNGIYINGAGFINTPKITLTTGTPNFANQTLKGFDVQKGLIDIQGEMLNLSNVDKAELYSEIVKLNTKLNAKNLDIITGENNISIDGKITAKDIKSDEKPTFSIDSTALGGIYANKINLIGTQKGVGVNLPIEIVAQDNLKINADGKLVLNKIKTNNTLNLVSQNDSISSNTLSGKDIDLNAKDTITNENTIASNNSLNIKAKNLINKNTIAVGINNKGELDTTKTDSSLSINTVNINNTNAKILSIGKIEITNKNNIDNKNSEITSYKDNIKIDTKNLTLNDSKLNSNENLNLNISNKINLKSSTLSANDDIELNTNDLTLDNTTIFNTNENKNIILNSKNINIKNDTNIESSNDLLIQNSTATSNIKDSSFFAQNNMILNQSNIILDSSKLTANNILLEAIKDIKATDSSILANALSPDTLNSYDINGIKIKAGNNITLSNENKESNKIASNNKIDINAENLNFTNLNIFNTNKQTSNNSKDILFEANNSFELISSNINSSNKLSLKSNTNDINLNNTLLESINDLELSAKNINTTFSNILTNNQLFLNSNTLNIKNSTLSTKNNLKLNFLDITGDNSNIYANKIDAKINNISLTNSNIKAQDSIKIKANNSIDLSNTKEDETKELAANNEISLDANTINLENKKLYNINKKDINLLAKQTINAKNSDINSKAKLNIISSLENINLYGSKLLAGQTNINANNKLNLSNSNIQSTSSLSLKGSNIENNNSILASKDDLIIVSENDLLNNNSKIISGNQLTINTNGKKNTINNTTLQADSNIKLVAKNIEVKNKSKLQTVLQKDDNKNIKKNSDGTIKQGDLIVVSSNFSLDNSSINVKDAKIDDNKKRSTKIEIKNNSTINANKNINLFAKTLKIINSSIESVENIVLDTTNAISNLVFNNTTLKAAKNITFNTNSSMNLDASNTIKAQKNLTLTTDFLTNNMQLEANNDLTINSNKNIINNQNAKIISNGTLNLYANTKIENKNDAQIKAINSILNTKNINNEGFISGSNTLNILSNDVINKGGIASNNLTINANNLTNYNTLYSTGNINLYIKNKLLNKTDNSQIDGTIDYATIFAKNNINIQGNKQKTQRTKNITNDVAILESNNGNINIFANELLNTNTDLDVEEKINIFNTITLKRNSGIGIYKGGKLSKHNYLGQSYGDVYRIVVTNLDADRSGPNFHKVYYLGASNPLEFYKGLNLVNINGNYYFASKSNLNKITATRKNLERINKNDTDLSKTSKIVTGGNLNLDISGDLENYVSLISANKNINFQNKNTNLINKSESIGKSSYLLRSDIGRVNLDGTMETYSATIEAGGDVKGNIKNLDNDGIKKNVKEYSYKVTSDGNVSSDKKNYNLTKKNLNVNTNDIDKSKDNLVTEENNSPSINIDLQNAKNENLLDTNSSVTNNPLKNDTYKINLPTNPYGQFVSTKPSDEQKYLVESNPLYTNLDNFTGSDYFLEKLNYKAGKKVKRLGDAAYETQLVRQSIINQTGKRIITNSFSSDNKQYVQLMDNAINLSGILNLKVGIEPTKQQLAKLDKNIVWMVEKQINGEKILVPQVYLANTTDTNTSALITANNIDLKTSENISNSGDIKAKNTLNLEGNKITNDAGVIVSNGNATLLAKEDITNQDGASIKADNLQLTSTNGSIINKTYTKTTTVKRFLK